MTDFRGKPLVTIGVPAEERDQEAFKAATEQTYSPLEVLVYGRGRGDGWSRWKRSSCVPGIRHVETAEDRVEAFNACLSAAKGEYILLLGAGDQVDGDLVETAISAVDGSAEFGFIRSGVRLVDETGQTVSEMDNETTATYRDELILSWLENRSHIHACTLLFNVDTLRRVGGFRSKHNLLTEVVAVLKLSANRPWKDLRRIKGSSRAHPLSAPLRKWCEEYHDVLRLMIEQLPEWREEIRDFGVRYFARQAVEMARTEIGWRRTIGLLITSRYFPRRYWHAQPSERLPAPLRER